MVAAAGTCCNIEHHGYVWLWPGKLHIQPPVLARHPVLQRALVEEVGGELAELRMHAVLHLQPEGADAQDHQPLKEGLAETAQGRLLAHDDRAQLAVFANQDQLFGSQHRRDHALGLRGLHALV